MHALAAISRARRQHPNDVLLFPAPQGGFQCFGCDALLCSRLLSLPLEDHGGLECVRLPEALTGHYAATLAGHGHQIVVCLDFVNG